MDNYVEELKTRIEELYQRIDKNRDMLVAYNLIEKDKSKYLHIFSLPSEYSCAAEPPVQCSVSHLSRRSEPQ